MISKKKRLIGRTENKFKWLEHKECTIQSEGHRTHKLHAEWTRVHDKMAHKEGNINRLQEQLENNERNVQKNKGNVGKGKVSEGLQT